MNPSLPSESEESAARRTAIALGESPVDSPMSDEARAEVEATRAMADALRAAYAREPGPSARRRNGRLRGAMAGNRSTVASWWPAWGAAAAACVALALVALHHKPAERAAVAETKPAPRPGLTLSLPNRAPTLASLAASMPGLPEAGAAFRPAGAASLALSAPHARAYAELVRKELASGRAVAASRLRVDALVNAFVGGRPVPVPGAERVQMEAVLVAAPWDATRRVLRVTVRGNGRVGEPVATLVAASVNFNAEAVAGWRVLGHEGATGARGSVALAGGDAVTTLFEIEPAAGASPEATLAGVTLDYSVGGERRSVAKSLRAGSADAFAATDADTRFAVGLAAYATGRTAGDSLLALAGGDADRVAFARAAGR